MFANHTALAFSGDTLEVSTSGLTLHNLLSKSLKDSSEF
jgi:hypothetical protein